jgi:hypothetical protein
MAFHQTEQQQDLISLDHHQVRIAIDCHRHVYQVHSARVLLAWLNKSV